MRAFFAFARLYECVWTQIEKNVGSVLIKPDMHYVLLTLVRKLI